MEKEELKPFYKVQSEIVSTLIDNTLRMLSKRVVVNGDNKFPLIDYNKASKEIVDNIDHIYTVKGHDQEIIIKIIAYRIQSLGKHQSIIKFIDAHKEKHKIFIFADCAQRPYDELLKKGVEVFKFDELMSDIIEHIYQPRYEILTPNEMKDVKESYNATNRQLCQIQKIDPVVKYYNLKKGDVIRIIRRSQTSLNGISYRIVN